MYMCMLLLVSKPILLLNDDALLITHTTAAALHCSIHTTHTTAAPFFLHRFLTGAIEAVSESSGLSQEFLGLIVLPIAGNACEHITAVFVAMKNKCDLALGVALGSSIQVWGEV